MQLYYMNIESPIGNIIAGATEQGVCFLDFYDDIMTHKVKLKKNLDRFVPDIIEGDNPILLKLAEELDHYFQRQLKQFTVPLYIVGTDFQKRVWEELLTIPYGQTRTYKEQSVALGDVKAIRAVANANGKNKISILIPCHRVIGSDGSLTGYAGGLERKQFLLGLESGQSDLL